MTDEGYLGARIFFNQSVMHNVNNSSIGGVRKMPNLSVKTKEIKTVFNFLHAQNVPIFTYCKNRATKREFRLSQAREGRNAGKRGKFSKNFIKYLNDAAIRHLKSQELEVQTLPEYKESYRRN